MKMSIFVCMTLVLAFACVQGMNLREGEGDLKKHKHKYGDWEIPNDDKRMYNGEGDLKKGPHKHKHGEGEGPIEVEDVDRRMGGRPHGPPPVLDAGTYRLFVHIHSYMLLLIKLPDLRTLILSHICLVMISSYRGSASAYGAMGHRVDPSWWTH